MNIIAVDIGNTNIVFGVTNAKETLANWRLSTFAERTQDEYRLFLSHFLASSGTDILSISCSVICSVVPAVTTVVADTLKEITGKPSLVIGKDIIPKFTVDIDNPSELGIDRLVNSFACHKLFGCPAVIVDFGTATTFDIVSGEASYIGGIICPGIKISLDALSQKTAQLPKISPGKPKSLIGKNTVQSILSGSYYGYLNMITGLIDQTKLTLQEIFPEKADSVKVIATGGFSQDMNDAVSKIDEIIPDLTLRGIFLVYSEHN